MKAIKVKLAALIVVPLLALSSQSFAGEPGQLEAGEPMQLSMAEMDNVTAAGFIDIYITIIFNYGELNIGNVQGNGGTGAVFNMGKFLKRAR